MTESVAAILKRDAEQTALDSAALWAGYRKLLADGRGPVEPDPIVPFGAQRGRKASDCDVAHLTHLQGEPQIKSYGAFAAGLGAHLKARAAREASADAATLDRIVARLGLSDAEVAEHANAVRQFLDYGRRIAECRDLDREIAAAEAARDEAGRRYAAALEEFGALDWRLHAEMYSRRSAKTHAEGARRNLWRRFPNLFDEPSADPAAAETPDETAAAEPAALNGVSVPPGPVVPPPLPRNGQPAETDAEPAAAIETSETGEPAPSPGDV